MEGREKKWTGVSSEASDASTDERGGVLPSCLGDSEAEGNSQRGGAGETSTGKNDGERYEGGETLSIGG